MTGTQLLYALGTVVTVLGAYFTAKLGARANDRKVRTEGEVSSGQLALNIATRLDGEVKELRGWRSRVQRWWPQHEDWDDELLRALNSIDPMAVTRLGPAPRLPTDDDPESDAAKLKKLTEEAERDKERRRP